MAKHEYTSKKIASEAAKQLKSKTSTPTQRRVAGSALTQTKDRKIKSSR